MNAMQALSGFLIGWPLLAVIVHLILFNQARYRRVAQSGLALGWLALTVMVFLQVQQPVVIAIGTWPAPFGISLVFDQLTALMLLVFAIAITCINWFSYTDHSIRNQGVAFYIGFWLLTLGITGAISTGDLFNLYVWAEVMLVSAFILLSCSRQPTTYSVAHYAIINIIGTLFMLLAIALTYGLTGALSYVEIANYFQSNDNVLIVPILCLLVFALALKGALFPLYFWLPKAYPRPSCSSTLLLSSLITKAILVILLRLVILWTPLHSELIMNLLLVVAWGTMFFGVMGAASQLWLRGILSFHIVSQLGYILLAIVLPSTLAIVAALYFLIHNIFVKTSLFMTAGMIEQHFATSNLKKLGQVLKDNKLLAGMFFIAALSLAGIPPLSGFWAKFLVIQAALLDQYYFSALLAILVSLFTLYSMIKIWRYVFCESSACQTAYQSRVIRFSFSSILAITPLLLIPIYMGLLPDGILQRLHDIAEQLVMQADYPRAMLGGVS